MKKLKILAIANDKGAGRVVKAMTDTLSTKGGHSVLILAGTNAMTEWASHPLGKNETVMQVDFSHAPVMNMALGFNPDVVLSGLSSPIKEHEILDAATKAGVKTVTFPDRWGAEVRWGGKPTLALAFDTLEEKFLKERGQRTMLVGDPLLSTVDTIPDNVRERIMELKRGKRATILISGQGKPWTLEHIHFVARTLRAELPENFVVIPRAHPKYFLNYPDGKRLWDEALSRLQQQCIVELPREMSTDHIAGCTDITVSTFGTSLRIAAHHGKTAVSVVNAEMRDAMLAETGFATDPLVTSQHAIGCEDSIDVAALLPTKPWRPRYTIGKFDPQAVVSSVESLFE